MTVIDFSTKKAHKDSPEMECYFKVEEKDGKFMVEWNNVCPGMLLVIEHLVATCKDELLDKMMAGEEPAI